jgi:hypothetical protein
LLNVTPVSVLLEKKGIIYLLTISTLTSKVSGYGGQIEKEEDFFFLSSNVFTLYSIGLELEQFIHIIPPCCVHLWRCKLQIAMFERATRKKTFSHNKQFFNGLQVLT